MIILRKFEKINNIHIRMTCGNIFTILKGKETMTTVLHCETLGLTEECFTEEESPAQQRPSAVFVYKFFGRWKRTLVIFYFSINYYFGIFSMSKRNINIREGITNGMKSYRNVKSRIEVQKSSLMERTMLSRGRDNQKWYSS